MIVIGTAKIPSQILIQNSSENKNWFKIIQTEWNIKIYYPFFKSNLNEKMKLHDWVKRSFANEAAAQTAILNHTMCHPFSNNFKSEWAIFLQKLHETVLHNLQ